METSRRFPETRARPVTGISEEDPFNDTEPENAPAAAPGSAPERITVNASPSGTTRISTGAREAGRDWANSQITREPRARPICIASMVVPQRLERRKERGYPLRTRRPAMRLFG